MAGYSQAELDRAELKWGFRFPPDLIAILRERRFVIEEQGSIDWVRSLDADIRRRLNWPFKGLWLDAQMNGMWWPEWGERPAQSRELYRRLRAIVAAAPKLIPVCGHRYIPDRPHEAGNPVFSVFYSDIIYYGADLADYVGTETGSKAWTAWTVPKTIEFWSHAVDLNDEGFRQRKPGEPVGTMRAKDLGLPPFDPNK